MKGYLKNESANHEYLVDNGGWYDTGDVVEITEEGSLKVIGRLRRFAKISGEMVSLTAVEEALSRDLAGRRDVAVMAVSDEHKGERLIVVTNSTEIDQKSLRDSLKRQGFPDLAIPRSVRFMKEIPKLGTGKLDYARLKDLIRRS